MAAGRSLDAFVTGEGFQLLQERSHTARAAVLPKSVRVAPLAEDEMSSKALQLLIGLPRGLFLSPKNKEVETGRTSPCRN